MGKNITSSMRTITMNTLKIITSSERIKEVLMYST